MTKPLPKSLLLTQKTPIEVLHKKEFPSIFVKKLSPMKKFVSLFIVAILFSQVLSSCKKKEETPPPPPTPKEILTGTKWLYYQYESYDNNDTLVGTNQVNYIYEFTPLNDFYIINQIGQSTNNGIYELNESSDPNTILLKYFNGNQDLFEIQELNEEKMIWKENSTGGYYLWYFSPLSN